MIILIHLCDEKPNRFDNDLQLRQEFDRIVIKTRFEKCSEYIWKMLSSLSNSFIYDLSKNSSNCHKNRIQRRKDVAVGFKFFTNCKLKGHNNIGFVDRTSWEKSTISHFLSTDDLFNLFKKRYIETVDPDFDPDFEPNDFKNKTPYGIDKDMSDYFQERQRKAIKSIDDNIERFNKATKDSSKKGAPNKNLWLYTATTVFSTVCKPKYSSRVIDKAFDSFDRQNSHRVRNILDSIQIKNVMFVNDVDFSNDDYRVIYDILKLFNMINTDLECPSRDNGNFMKSIYSQSKKVEMLCFYETFHGSDIEENIRMMHHYAKPFRENDRSLLTCRMNPTT